MTKLIILSDSLVKIVFTLNSYFPAWENPSALPSVQ